MISRRSFVLALAVLPIAGRVVADGAIYMTGGIAIRGMDPVAYFTQGKPVQGNPDHAVMWRGATWYFSSAENAERFMRMPRKYSPQYGGHCAYAASKGALAPTDPNAFTIHDGKLYLNFSKQVREIWAQDIPGNVEKADAYWPELIGR